MIRRLAIAVWLTGGLLHAPATIAQTVRESTSVVAVEVPVHVVRDGRPVRGLTRDDFIVLDERKPQEITGFDVIDLTAISAANDDPRSPAAPQVPQVPVTARRHFLLLFDLTFSQPDSVANTRDAARELLTGALHPADLVAVATYSHGTGPRLLCGFTSDRPQIAAAIDSLGLTQLIEPLRDPLGLVFGDFDGAARAFDLGRGSSEEARRPGRVGRRAAAEEKVDLARRMELADQRQDLTRVTALTRSLVDLARLMDSVRGRKHVVYLSEGFDTTALFGTADVERTQRMSSASEQGRVWEVDSEERYGDTRSQSQLEEMFSAFRRADCTVQTVDIGGIQRVAGVESGSRRSAERTRTVLAARHDSLGMMASATGGEFYRNFNDLAEAMGEVLERTGVTYVLTFQPRKLPLDGAYHRLKVKLRDGSKGRPVHRPGYYAPRPFAELSEDERRLATASLVVGGREGGAFSAAVLASPFPAAGADGVGAYVSLFVEIDGRGLAAATPGDTLTADLYAYAFDQQGRVRDFLGHTLSIDLRQARSTLEQSGVKYYGHFDLPAGAYSLRTLVRDRESGLYALRSHGLSVPDFPAAEPALLPPFFTEAPGKWVMAREELGADSARPPFPFMVGEEPFLPAAHPTLARGESATVNLIGYHLGDEPRIASRIRTPQGADLARPTLTVGRIVAGRAGRTALQATLDTGPLDAGGYTLIVTATDPATGHQATSSSGFAVVER